MLRLFHILSDSRVQVGSERTSRINMTSYGRDRNSHTAPAWHLNRTGISLHKLIKARGGTEQEKIGGNLTTSVIFPCQGLPSCGTVCLSTLITRYTAQGSGIQCRLTHIGIHILSFVSVKLKHKKEPEWPRRVASIMIAHHFSAQGSEVNAVVKHNRHIQLTRGKAPIHVTPCGNYANKLRQSARCRRLLLRGHIPSVGAGAGASPR